MTVADEADAAIHADREHSFRLDRPADEVFALFTPAGEAAWVPGWRPVFVHPVDGTTVAGMVFLTDFDGEDTIWTCVRHDAAAHEVGYVRVTPGSRVALVDVAVAATGDGGSDVRVRYRITALSPTGEAIVAATTPAAFAERIDGWRHAIGALPRDRSVASIRG